MSHVITAMLATVDHMMGQVTCNETYGARAKPPVPHVVADGLGC